jgi:hypothetical protein
VGETNHICNTICATIEEHLFLFGLGIEHSLNRSLNVAYLAEHDLLNSTLSNEIPSYSSGHGKGDTIQHLLWKLGKVFGSAVQMLARAGRRLAQHSKLTLTAPARRFTMQSAPPGPRQTEIVQKLSATFQPLHLEVENESYKHSVPRGSETHFKVPKVIFLNFDNVNHYYFLALRAHRTALFAISVSNSINYCHLTR